MQFINALSTNRLLSKQKRATRKSISATAPADVGPKDITSHFTTGNTHPGAVVPWGMVSVGPHNDMIFDGDQSNLSHMPGSSYNHENKTLFGFGHLHLSGVGCNDWGNILMMPSNIKPTGKWIHYKTTYSNEKAKPGYYSAFLDKSGILAEMTATIRTGLSKYTFTKATPDATVAIDLYYNQTKGRDAFIRIVSDTEIEGWTENGGFCGQKSSQRVHFVAKFNKQSKALGTTLKDEVAYNSLTQNKKESGGFMTFDMKEGEVLMVKVGLSFVSIKNARENMNEEQPGWDFDKVKQNASNEWNKQLSKIMVEGASNKEKTIFYTSMYHALLHPNIFNDVNGEYLAMGSKQVARLSGDQKYQYTVFSLWDTYRNLHQLLTLIYPNRQLDMVRSMVNMAKENGYLPKWELAANETGVMVGDPGPIVVADTYLKGLTDFDVEAAMAAMDYSFSTRHANLVRSNNADYLKYGYIPLEATGGWGPTATSLETYFSDYAMANMAKAIGQNDAYDRYYKQSLGYLKFYDKETSFLRPLLADGTFLKPFNPDTLKGSLEGADFICGGPGYVEGNAWQYNFMVPEPTKLVEVMGKENYIARLKACFDDPSRFVLFNEPDMAYPYLFNYVDGYYHLTQKTVRNAMNTYYGDTPGGLPGNDDTGVLSSWYIFSALGFYPTQPGSTIYALGIPMFTRIEIKLDKKFYASDKLTIEAASNKPTSVMVNKVKLNGKLLSNPFIYHKELTESSLLQFYFEKE